MDGQMDEWIGVQMVGWRDERTGWWASRVANSSLTGEEAAVGHLGIN